MPILALSGALRCEPCNTALLRAEAREQLLAAASARGRAA